MQSKTNQEIVQILYAHGHSTYHPVLADALEAYIHEKFEQARKEQEALDNTMRGQYQRAQQNVAKQLADAALIGDRDAVSVYSQAMQRLCN